MMAISPAYFMLYIPYLISFQGVIGPQFRNQYSYNVDKENGIYL